jgi:predicted peptidase
LPKEQYSTLAFTNAAGWVMQYDLYLPATYTPEAKLPLIVMMHGMGPPDPVKRKKGWGLPLLKMNPAYNETNYPIIVCEPVKNTQCCWRAMTYELIPVLSRQYGCDTNRCYVSGVSGGGYATWNMITERPDLFAAAVPICGGGDTSKASRIAAIPIWAFHGTADNRVPVKATRETIAAVEAAGGKPKVTYFEGGKPDGYADYGKSEETLRQLRQYCGLRSQVLVPSHAWPTGGDRKGLLRPP